MRTWVNYHPYTVARLWRGASAIARQLQNHPRLSVVRFEDLLESPEATMRDLCERIHIDYEPAMLDVGQINSSHQSSVGGARKGLHKDAIDKWKTELLPAEISITERYCGSLMENFGYRVQEAVKESWCRELRYRFSYSWHIAGVFMVNPRRALIQMRAVLSKFGSSGSQTAT